MAATSRTDGSIRDDRSPYDNCSTAKELLKRKDELLKGAINAGLTRLDDAVSTRRQLTKVEGERARAEARLLKSESERLQAEARLAELELALRAYRHAERTTPYARLGSDPILLAVGVISSRSPASSAHRSALRSMLRQKEHPTSRHLVAIRFVLPDGNNASKARQQSDELSFPVAAGGRILRNHLLTCAFFAYAVRLPSRPRFVARADDASFFIPSTIATELSLFSGIEPLVYGFQSEWYMWEPAAMMGACFSFSPQRYYAARLHVAARSSNVTVPRHVRECLHPSLQGPFPFTRGALVAYSMSTVAQLLASSEFQYDILVDRVGARQRSVLLNPLYGKVFLPSQRNHPGRTLLNDDVYFGWLLWRVFSNRSLTLISARMAEWTPAYGRIDWDPAYKLDDIPKMQFVRHLKAPRRLQYVNASRWIVRRFRKAPPLPSCAVCRTANGSPTPRAHRCVS